MEVVAMTNSQSVRFSGVVTRTLATVVVSTMLLAHAEEAAAKLELEGKVVLANLDRYSLVFRVGKIRKDIAPRKASVLSPRSYPLTLEYWSGNKQVGWKKTSITAAGVYTFRYQGGHWSVARREPESTASRPSESVSRTTRRAIYSRSVGTRTGVPVRRGGQTVVVQHGPCVPVLCHVLWAAALIYDHIHDDWWWRRLLEHKWDDDTRRELEDWLKEHETDLSDDEQRELEKAIENLDSLKEEDWETLEKATDEDWEDARDLLGDKIDDQTWEDLENDLDDIGVEDLTAGELAELETLGIDELSTDVDLSDLGDIEADLGGLFDNVDISDLAVDVEDLDIGDMGIDLGDDLDVGGGMDSGGGLDWDDYDTGGFDSGDDWGSDAGSFDDFGGGFDF